MNGRQADAILKAIALSLLYGFLLRRAGARRRTATLLVCGNLVFMCVLSPPAVIVFPYNFGLVMILGAACYVGCLPWSKRVAVRTFAAISTLIAAIASWFAVESRSAAFLVTLGATLAFGFAYLVNHPTPSEITFLDPDSDTNR